MEPTLSSRDFVIARRVRFANEIGVGQVVLANFDCRPDLLVVKRVQAVSSQGLWLVGDNAIASDASEKYGWAQAIAIVVVRYWPRPGRIC